MTGKGLVCASLVFALTTVQGSSAVAQASCENARLRVDEANAQFRYLPFSGRDAVETIRVGVVGAEDDCALSLVLDAAEGDRLVDGGSRLRYALEVSGARRLRLDGGEPVEIALRGAAMRAGIELLAVLPAGQPAAPGYYRDSILLQLLENGRILDQREIAVGADVVPQASIAAGRATSSGFTGSPRIDFGSIEAGESESVVLFARSNARYSLTVSSANASALVHETQGGPSGRIAYDAFLDGRRLDLTGPEVLLFSGPSDARLAERFKELRVVIGETEGRVAGRYRDVVTVVIDVYE